MKQNNAGNALWFILLAIFLLGGLTVLLSRTGSNTEETGSAERLNILATEIIRYGNGIRTGVDSLLQRGCGESQLSFWYDENNDGLENASDLYYNPSSPIDRSCHIFSKNGAGINRKTAENFFKSGLWGTSGSLSAIKYNEFSAWNSFVGVGKSDGTGAGTELYWGIEFPYNIDRVKLCTQINTILGYQPSTPPVSHITINQKFTGTYRNPPTHLSATELNAKKAYCISFQPTPQRHIFYYILLAR